MGMSAAGIKAEELRRLRSLGIEPDGMIVRNGLPVAVIAEDVAMLRIDEGTEATGRFLVRCDTSRRGGPFPSYTATATANGLCWCEDFWTEDAALGWLTDGGRDTDGWHIADLRSVMGDPDRVCPPDHPDRPTFLDRVRRDLEDLL